MDPNKLEVSICLGPKIDLTFSRFFDWNSSLKKSTSLFCVLGKFGGLTDIKIMSLYLVRKGVIYLYEERGLHIVNQPKTINNVASKMIDIEPYSKENLPLEEEKTSRNPMKNPRPREVL